MYATPSWQTGTGVPTVDPGATTHHRYLPDVSLSAAGHDGYLMVQEGGLYLVGGTSAASPSFAGILAMIDQYSGGRNGNPNAKFYPLAAHTPSVYHDVVTGNNQVPCAGGSPNCSAAKPATNIGKMNGYVAGAGYDLATGWGSVDAYELALNWGSSVPPAGPAITALSPNPMTGSASTQTLTIAGSGFTAGTGLKVVLTSGTHDHDLSGGADRFGERYPDPGGGEPWHGRPELDGRGGESQREDLQRGRSCRWLRRRRRRRSPR